MSEVRVECGKLSGAFQSGCNMLGYHSDTFGGINETTPPGKDDRYVEAISGIIQRYSAPLVASRHHSLATRSPTSLLHPNIVPDDCFHATHTCIQRFCDFLRTCEPRRPLTHRCVSRLMHFSLASYLPLLVGEAITPFTGAWLGVPKQPNRDHHLGHTLTVFKLGAFFLSEELPGQQVLAGLKTSEVFEAFKSDCEKQDKRVDAPEGFPLVDLLEDCPKLAWLLAALCHDAAYPIQIGRFLAEPLNLGEWFDARGPTAPGRGVVKENFEWAMKGLRNRGWNEIANHFGVILDKLNEHRLAHNAGNGEEIDLVTDHGFEMAVLLLVYAAFDEIVIKLPREDLFSLFLAIEAIALHSYLGKQIVLANHPKGAGKLKELIRNWPFASLLTFVDLISEANRVHWSLIDHCPRSEGHNQVRLDRAHIPNYEFRKSPEAQDWEKKWLLGVIVGIQAVAIECLDGKLNVTFEASFDKDKTYGPVTSSGGPDYSPHKAVFGNENEATSQKRAFLTQVAEELLNLELRHYGF